MIHLPLLPVLLPLAAAILQLALHRAGLATARAIGFVSVGLLAVVAVLLLRATADGAVHVTALGDWAPPFGIAFVADRLAATMVAVTVAVAIPALLAATDGTDRAGPHFHPFFQLQLAGLAGAFLTGDLFNLFVFFEVLLIASYGLLAHGGGAARARAGLHYVALNLTGSILFLIALGLLYGTMGTLNLADVAGHLAAVPEADRGLVRTALALLLLVFAFKAALLPLGFWLPRAYAAASAPVAALFAVLTKVGIYAMLRVSTVALEGAGWTAGLLAPWLLPAGLATVVVATLGVLAARTLGTMVAHLLLLSTGMLAVGIAAGGVQMHAALLYYLPHTTLVSAGLFLLVGRIIAWRDVRGDRITVEREAPRPPPGALWPGCAFLLLGIAVTGLPPLSGFLGKVMMLAAAPDDATGAAIWVVFIVSGFVAALAMARAASVLFWEGTGAPLPTAAHAAPRGRADLALALSLGFVPLLVLGAAPLAAHARATAEQVAARLPYLEAVLPRGSAAVARTVRP